MNVPIKLQQLNQWLIWGVDETKPKLPYSPITLSSKDWTNPINWGDFPLVDKLVKDDKAKGIGFAFNSNGYYGIDLDNVFIDGELIPEAKEIVNILQSPTELSQSCNGLHIFVEANNVNGNLKNITKAKQSFINYPKSDKRGIEIYYSTGYFAITGNSYGDNMDMVDRSKELEEVYSKYFIIKEGNTKNHVPSCSRRVFTNEEIISKALNSSQEFLFNELFNNGEWQNRYNSQSDADLALCNILAFWTGRNVEQMDEIFRLSSLMRDKWDNKHSGDGNTYGEITIQKAIEDCEDVHREYKDKYYLREAHKLNKNGEPTSVIDMNIVNYILNNYHIVIIDGSAFMYENGVYVENEFKLMNIIQNLIYRDLIKINTINRIYALLIAQPQIQRSSEEVNKYDKKYIINFKNGMYDCIKDELLPHDPKYLSINQIPHNWVDFIDLDLTKGDYFDNFLKFALLEDDIPMLLEYIGYCLTTDNSQQKMLMLKGASGTGKSTLLNLITSIVGNSNISAIALQKLSERFYATNLRGKLLNICADISSEAMKDISVIKQATGEDTLMFEKKGKDPSFFTPYAKLIFSANKIPRNIDEQSHAYYRRLLIVEMNNKPEEINRELDNQLLSEIDYIIFTAVSHLKDMYERGKIYESENSKKLVNELHKETDSVTAFIEDCTQQARGEKILRKTLFEAYKWFCSDEGKKNLTRNTFNDRLRDKGYIEKRVNGYDYWADIKIKEEFSHMLYGGNLINISGDKGDTL